jgi:hypothetical protein
MPNLDSYPQDEFNAIADRVEMHYMPAEHVSVEVKILRDVVSLRKLNNNLISVSWMDDFLVDCYMKIYKLVRHDGRGPETAISIDLTSREASVNGEGEDSSSRRQSRVSRKEILQKVFALCKPPPAPTKAVFPAFVVYLTCRGKEVNLLSRKELRWMMKGCQQNQGHHSHPVRRRLI